MEVGKSWEVEAILGIVEQIKEKVVSNGDAMYLSGRDFNEINDGFQELADHIFDYNEMSKGTMFRIDNILHILTNIAEGDFSELPYQSKYSHNHFDAIAEGVKLMISELKPRWDELIWYKKLFDKVDVDSLYLDEPFKEKAVNYIQRLYLKKSIHTLTEMIERDKKCNPRLHENGALASEMNELVTFLKILNN